MITVKSITESKFETLKKLASDNGYTVGTFCTNGSNFYQNACLYIAIGVPYNRYSNLVQETWDVSYSMGRSDTGNNKWARALQYATDWINENGAAVDTEDSLNKFYAQRAKIRKNELAKKRRVNKKTLLEKTCSELTKLTPTTLRAVVHKLNPRLVESFGITPDEHDELMDEAGLIAEYNGRILVKQTTMQYGYGWYPLQIGYPEPLFRLDENEKPLVSL